MRQRTSGPYARAVFGSSIAAATQRTAGSAAFTAAIRSAVKVAIPQRLGIAEATKAILTTPFCGNRASLPGNAVSRRFEDARGETRANSTGAVRHDLPI